MSVALETGQISRKPCPTTGSWPLQVRDQGPEDKGLSGRNWRFYLRPYQKGPKPLCNRATAYESPALPLSYLAARKTIPHSKGRTTDEGQSRHGDQEPWKPLLYHCA